jgi:hypothetical protein
LGRTLTRAAPLVDGDGMTEPVVQVAPPSMRLRLLRWSVSPRLHATVAVVGSAVLWGSHALEIYVWLFAMLSLMALVPLVWILTATGIVVGRQCRIDAPYGCALRWQALLGGQFLLHFYWLTGFRWGC